MDSKNNLVGIILIAVIAILVLGVIAFNNGANENDSDDVIHISQNEQTEVVPDRIKVTLSVVSLNDDVSVAMNENTEINNKIVNAFKADYKVETKSYNIREKTQWNSKLQESEVLGYEVYNTIEITSEDITDAGEIVKDGVNLGANRVESVAYIVSIAKQEEIKADLLETAVEKAKVKADSVASLMDKKVVEIDDISFSDSYYPVYRNDYSNLEKVASDMDDIPSFEAGSQTISLNVNVAFEVE